MSDMLTRIAAGLPASSAARPLIEKEKGKECGVKNATVYCADV